MSVSPLHNRNDTPSAETARTHDLVIASTNPVKIQAAYDGFRRLFPERPCQAHGISVPSGISAQPMTSEETLLGAQSRAAAARQALPDAAYWFGIEGGCEDTAHGLAVFAWIVVMARPGNDSQESTRPVTPEIIGKSRTSTFYLPEEVARLVRQGLELGDADDAVFRRINSKQQNGSVGLLTGDVVTRLTYYEQAVILALIPFRNPSFTFI